MHKASTRTDYNRRIQQATDFIISNLQSDIQLKDIAAASHFSAFHFHRIFHAIMNETVNDFVLRKRMELAVHWLICKPEFSVTEIGQRLTYSSTANFSKAFKLYFGISPGQLRKPQSLEDSKTGKLFSKYGKTFSPAALYPQIVNNTSVKQDKKDIPMNITIKQLNEIPAAYLTAPGGYELDSIFETWDKLIQWAKQAGIKNDNRYALCHDNPVVTPLEKCRYDALIEVDNETTIPANFEQASIPAGRYACAHFKGDGDKVTDFYLEFYRSWLPDSGFEPDDYPPVAHYLNDSRVDGYVDMELLIKLKS